MAAERKTRKSKQLKKKQPPASITPPKRAHLAQKSLFNSAGKPTGIEVVLPPHPLPSMEDILYCGPEPDFEAVYFSIYDNLARHCYDAEKTRHVDSDVIKENAKASLRSIKNTTQSTNNKHILALFDNLAQLISDLLISPKKLKHRHLKRFLSKKTKAVQEDMTDYLSPVSDEELLPFISAFKKLTLHEQPIIDNVPAPEEEEEVVVVEPIEELEDLGPLPDEFPAALFPDAPKFIYTTSFSKIMSKIEKPHRESQKRPESPSSGEETTSPTLEPVRKKAALMSDRALAVQLQFGLRQKSASVNNRKIKETSQLGKKNIR